MPFFIPKATKDKSRMIEVSEVHADNVLRKKESGWIEVKRETVTISQPLETPIAVEPPTKKRGRPAKS